MLGDFRHIYVFKVAFFVGCIIASLIILFKYKLVSPDDVSKLGIAFYRINAYVSSAVFIGTLIAVLI